MENDKRKSIKKEIIEWIKSMVITIIAGIIITTFVSPTVVVGESMSNTLMPYDYLFVYKKAYSNKLPGYKDIVLAQSSIPITDSEGTSYIFSKIKSLYNKNEDKKIVIKRVIGLPGDIIYIGSGNVYRNGELLVEEYTRDGVTFGEGTYVVPDNHLFLLGDNRQGSMDSRNSEIGMVSMDDIIGKVIIRVFPFNKITTEF